jgi:alkylation response protein AidB-like acyl-CoA dehydrogenase
MTAFASIHDELRRVAREMLQATSPLANEGSPVPLEWDLMARSGWLGVEVDESLGGGGATVAELGVVLVEMGRAAAASAYLGSAVLGVGALHLALPTPHRDDLVRRLASGETRLAVALPCDETVLEAPAAPFTLLEGTGGPRLRGVAGFVADANVADLLLVPAASPGGDVVLAAIGRDTAGLTITPRPVVDATRGFASVEADDVEVDEGRLWRLAGAELLERLVDRGAFAVACDSLGLAEAMLDETVSYAALRAQFGRPIGSFQAVKHACADMLVQVRVCQELVSAAAEALVKDAAEAWVEVSKAKSQVCAAAVEVAGKAMQLHGGIGYTWERGIHAYLKRAALNRSLFGSPAAHRRLLARRYSSADERATGCG